MAHDNTLANLRLDNYSFGGFEELAQLTAKYDYTSLDYDNLRDIYNGLESTGMQYGGLLARTIVDILSAFEIGALPTPVVYDTSNGAENQDVTKFVQTFLNEQHWNIFTAVNTKNCYGDGYLVFNLDRNLESLPPQMVFPGWAPFSDKLDSATVIQVKKLKSQNDSATADLTVIRNYNLKQIKYQAEIATPVKGVIKPRTQTMANPLGVCPVVHLPNLRPAGYQFGVSDFYSSIPYFLMLHQTIMRGFESQQYSGRPILTITGIEGSVKQWVKLSFDIDLDALSPEDATSKLLAIFKNHKLLFLSGSTKAEFVESKVPIGKTEEMVKLSLGQIARMSSVPEFVFGASLDQANASIREQYAALQAKIEVKQAALTPILRHIIRMAMVWYTVMSRNDETGEPLETFGIVNTYADALKNFKIELIWPEFLGSEQRTKIEALSMLSGAGAISRRGLMNNYPTLIPSPDGELAQIEDEMALFAPPEIDPETGMPSPNQPQAVLNSKERNRKAAGKGGNNPHSTATNQPGSNKAGK